MERGSAEEWARRRGCVFICKRGGSIIIPASKCPFVARFLDSSRPKGRLAPPDPPIGSATFAFCVEDADQENCS